MKKIALVCSSLVLAVSLAACTPNISPNTYTGDQVGAVAHVVPATVMQTRAVTITQDSKVGGVTGAIAGGVGASAIGGGGRAPIIAIIGGAIIGGVAGSAIDKALHTGPGYEYILQTKDGKLLSVTQSGDLKLHEGEHVLIIYGDLTRIVPDDEIPTALTNSPNTSNAPAVAPAAPQAPAAAPAPAAIPKVTS
ncbi:MAG: hypothetical protein EBX40_06075 [Gammaproteobacteria bacterium]|nr:hypothetical protein [Gammaproteobacteria bacterium]